VLVDGYLIHAYPPSPMEIHDVLTRGVTVIGTASLGAIRAVELRPFGMIGMGWVHEQFASGDVDRDDEIVVACDERSGRALTVPMINVRFAIKAFYKTGRIVHAQAEAALAAVAALYLEERTRASVRAALCRSLPDELADEALSPAYDIKARDTMWTLLRMSVHA
jgi:hypothetical protein